MESVTVFLTSSSHKEWVELDLISCYMQDHGLHILHCGLLHCNDIAITTLVLRYNGLIHSSSMISNINVSCKVKERLSMSSTHLSNTAAITLFNTLKDNNTLKHLHIEYNDVTDDASDAITTAMERNSHLVTLSMHGNPLTGEAIVNIVNSLKGNNTLSRLWLPIYPEDIKKIISSLQEVINEKRESRECQVKLIISYYGSFSY